ncbi:MAG: tetratricopeptide repeat protein [Deltaproteobacteria bacterium]|nr:MAG: tetratricopeptide repeat protein [Deltaproteobacteria bacterium]
MIQPSTRHLLVTLSLAAAGWWCAHLAQLSVDEQRLSHEARAAGRVMPDPAAMRAASMGQPTMVAHLLWIEVALNFADLVEHPDPQGPEWLLQMLRSVLELDPGWRTAYFYGGSMMRVLGDIDGSDEVFGRALEDLPDDPYFPFSLGMNAYLYRKDTETATKMLDRAASLPGAPAWYRAAAAGFLDESGQRQAALAYIEEEMKTETEEAVLRSLRRKRASLLHDELADRLDRQLAAARAAAGRPDGGLELLTDLPPDPLGGHWILAPDGHVRSDVADRSLARRDRDRERAMITRRR